jgi:hypothetical protein
MMIVVERGERHVTFFLFESKQHSMNALDRNEYNRSSKQEQNYTRKGIRRSSLAHTTC